MPAQFGNSLPAGRAIGNGLVENLNSFRPIPWFAAEMGNGKHGDTVGKFFVNQGKRELLNPPFSCSVLAWMAPNGLFTNGSFSCFNGI